MKRAKKETKKLKTYLGRLLREIERKSEQANEKVHELLELAKKLYRQKRDDKGKLYSIHAPEVECISKGKAHKRYEFGCKVRMVTTSKGNWILGIDAIHGNPYDGHTLKASIEQATKIAGWQPKEAYCDKGYRGSETIEGTTIQLTNRKKKSVSRREWKWFKRRSAIEPIFGHLKSDNKLERNHLKGKEGDRINAILAGCGFNMRKLLRAFFLLIIYWLKFGRDTEMNSHSFTKIVTPVS
jgi:IS5 family transposase